MKLSALSLVPVREGFTRKQAIDSVIREAKLAEELGFERFWIAEHHNIRAYASSATQILVSTLLHHTQRIKVGAGGVMLPNHSPLIVAEQYGTLATLFPNRVEIGVGRAKGTDPFTAAALRRQAASQTNHEQDVADLQTYFGKEQPNGINAYPGVETNVPIFVLGSSPASAYFAAEKGLPYAFASHFLPMQQKQAAEIYRQNFKPSEHCAKPYMVLCLNVNVAETDAEAHYTNSTLRQLFLNEQRGENVFVKQPVENMDSLYYSAGERHSIDLQSGSIFIGSKDRVTKQYADFMDEYAELVDEIMLTGYIFDEEKWLDSLRKFTEIVKSY